MTKNHKHSSSSNNNHIIINDTFTNDHYKSRNFIVQLVSRFAFILMKQTNVVCLLFLSTQRSSINLYVLFLICLFTFVRCACSLFRVFFLLSINRVVADNEEGIRKKNTYICKLTHKCQKNVGQIQVHNFTVLYKSNIT